MQFGRYLEEFEEGAVYKHWPGRTITQADDIAFCMLTMNHHPLHIDEEFGRNSQFGQNVVVGNLCCGYCVWVERAGPFQGAPSPTSALMRYGSTSRHSMAIRLYAETEVLSVRPSDTRPDRGVVTVETRATNQRKEMVMTFKRSVLIPRQPEDSEG